MRNMSLAVAFIGLMVFAGCQGGGGSDDATEDDAAVETNQGGADADPSADPASGGAVDNSEICSYLTIQDVSSACNVNIVERKKFASGTCEYKANVTTPGSVQPWLKVFMSVMDGGIGWGPMAIALDGMYTSEDKRQKAIADYNALGKGVIEMLHAKENMGNNKVIDAAFVKKYSPNGDSLEVGVNMYGDAHVAKSLTLYGNSLNCPEAGIKRLAEIAVGELD